MASKNPYKRINLPNTNYHFTFRRPIDNKMKTQGLWVLVLAAALGIANADFSWDFCAEDSQCSVGQGDCDRDAHCEGTLVCSRYQIARG